MASPEEATASPLPIELLFWGALGIALNVGLARFTYGVMLPSIRRDLGLDYLGSGNLNAVHLAGYLVGTLAAPSIIARTGASRLSRQAHLLVAAAAAVCAVAPESMPLGAAVLGFGRAATGLGAGAGIVAILVIVFGAVPARRRPVASAVVWSGMGAAIVASGFAVPLLIGPAIGWRCAFACSALLALAVAAGFPPRAHRGCAATTITSAGRADFPARRLLAAMWLYLLGTYLMFGIAYVAYSTFAGAQLATMNAPATSIMATWIGFGATAVLGAALTVPLITSPRTRRFALVSALATGAIGALVAGLDTPAAAIVGALLVGLGLASTPSIITAYARDRCSAADYPKVFSYATAALGIGQLLGPVAGGALADRLGTGVIPLFAASAYGLGAIFALTDALVARRLPQ